MINGRNANLTVVRGDLPLSPGLSGGDFVMAEATDTRLMGVVGLHMVRRTEDTEFHQLFYLDFEEYGFDEYRSFRLYKKAPMDEVGRNMLDLFGGLGGSWNAISEKEAIHLIHHAIELNMKYDVELPEGEEEYSSILDANPALTDEEEKKLWSKICVYPENDYETLTYFIMRHAAMDDVGRDYLTAPESQLKLFTMTEPGTLYRNEIEPVNEGRNSISLIREYHSSSLISDDMGFRLITSSASVAGPKVISFTVYDDMRITPWESSLIMNRKEYISLLHASGTLGGTDITMILRMLYPEAETHTHPGGTLLMILRKDNRHVANPIYRLDNDVLASVFVRHGGELTISCSDTDNLRKYESLISMIARKYNLSLSEITRYSFPESVLGHYVNEDYGEFDSFLDFLQFLRPKDSE